MRELRHALAVKPDDNTIDEEALVDETLMISVCGDSDLRPKEQRNPLNSLYYRRVL